MHHHVNHDRRSENRRHGADRQLGRGKHRPCDQVAEQAEHRAAKETARNQQKRLRRPHHRLDKMRHRDPHERDRACERRDARRQDTREQDQRNAEAPDIDAHIPRIALPELICADRLRHQERQHQRYRDYHEHHTDIAPARPGEASHRPVVQVHYIRIVRKGHDEIRDGGADIPDHHAADHENRHLLHSLRDEQDKAHRNHRTHKGRRDQDRRARTQPAFQQENHDERNNKLRARRDTEHERPRDRISEKRLQQKTGHRQRTAENQRRQDTRQPDLPDDIAGGRIARAVHQNVKDFADAKLHAAGIDIKKDQQQQQHGKRCE